MLFCVYFRYTGATCDIDINECASNPCEHGGTCTDYPNMFRCACPPGTQGIRYESYSLSICFVKNYSISVDIYGVVSSEWREDNPGSQLHFLTWILNSINEDQTYSCSTISNSNRKLHSYILTKLLADTYLTKYSLIIGVCCIRNV